MKLNRTWLRMHQRKLMRHNTNTDAILRSNERSIFLEEGAISRVDVSQLAANKPVEDFFSASKCLSSNAHLFGVFDGHGGAACSRHVSTRLFDYLCAAVLEKHKIVELPLDERLQWLFSSAGEKLPSFSNEFKSSGDLVTVRKAIQAACVALDEDLSNDAMPDYKGQVCRVSVNVALSGACALIAHVRENNLHVANVGDSEAVLGVVHPNGIISRLMSRPHCSDNTDELARVKNAHPASEINTILKGGRLLGELYPLRAFGDIRYKWPQELQRVVLEPLGHAPPNGLHTPPYLTAMPEVLYHQLTPNDRFLVLATDGLWECLDPDTVVRLINDHTLGTQTLSPFQPKEDHTLADILGELEKRKKGGAKKPLDENSATHVIRNALGGCSGGQELQYSRLQKSLQLPPGAARHFRDDITVVVIHFDENYLSQAHEVAME